MALTSELVNCIAFATGAILQGALFLVVAPHIILRFFNLLLGNASRPDFPVVSLGNAFAVLTRVEDLPRAALLLALIQGVALACEFVDCVVWLAGS